MYRLTTIIACVAAMLAAGLAPLPAEAQARGRSQQPEVPRGYEPPRGMCRIWITGVPPNQQPAPTDCATAIRRLPSNGRVVFGAPANEQPRRTAPEVKELVPPRKQEPSPRKQEPPPRAQEPTPRTQEPSREREKSSPSPERRRGPPNA